MRVERTGPTYQQPEITPFCQGNGTVPPMSTMARPALGACVLSIALFASACSGAAPPAPPDTAIPTDAPPPTTTMFAPVTTLPPLTTTTQPAASVPTEPQRRPLVISGTGDVNLDPTFIRTFPTVGYAHAWTGLGGLFETDDLTVVNLECSASSLGSPWNKPYTFRCDPDALPSMAAAGVEVANLANNHAIDYGFEAMLDARENLIDNGIAPVGAGKDSAEAYAPALFDIKGWIVAVLGGGGAFPETGSWIAGEDRPGMTNGDSVEQMTAAIRDADEVADLVIVTIHWGEEGGTTPRAFEVELAKAFIDAGADGIFGHHQHRLNPLGWYGGKPIAWGLGNFVWQAYPVRAKRTAIAQFTFGPDGAVTACLVPVVIEETGHPVVQTPDPTPCQREEAD